MSSLPMALISFFIFIPVPALLIISLVIALRRDHNNMNNKNDAKYVFYYLLSLVALIFTAFSVGMISFSIINKMIPDVINNYISSAYDSQLKFAISALFIAAPIFYYISHLIFRGLRREEITRESGVRRWLTYFVLLISSFVILGVFISTINNFLSGELTSRFALKALTVFVLSAIPFSFYFYDIKRANPEKPDAVVKVFFFGTLALVLAAFISAWFFVESPQVARARRLDQVVVNNITSLESAINTYYDNNKKLPDSLVALKTEKGLYLDDKIFVDPETQAPIVYQKTKDKEFSLCATFRTDSIANRDVNGSIVNDIYSKQHKSGYQCLPGNLYTTTKAEAVK